MELRDLIQELKTAFPNLDEMVLKSALLDLILKLEDQGSGSVMTKSTAPVRSTSSKPAPEAKVVIETIAEVEEAEQEPEQVQEQQLLMDSASWADLAKNSKPAKGKVESAFDFEDTRDTEVVAAPSRRSPTLPPAPKTSIDRKQRIKNEARKNRDEFVEKYGNLSDKEIAIKLSQQFEAKKTGGQFTDLGSDQNSFSDDLIF